MTLPTHIAVATVKTWIDQLPCANKPLVTHESFEMLRRIDQCGQPPAARLKAVLAMEHAIEVVLDYVRVSLASGQGPTERVLATGEAYCERLVELYRHIADDAANGTRLFKTHGTARRATGLAARSLEQWLRLRAIDHRPAPRELWQQARSLQRRPQRDDATLARMAAFHLASTHRMSGRDILDLAELLDALPVGRLVTIDGASESDGEYGFFLPDGDNPPEFGPLPRGARAISLEGLTAQLRSSPPAGFDRRLLQTLLDRWDSKPRPKATRTTPTRPIKTTAVIGLGGIIRHLSDLNPTFGLPITDSPTPGFGDDSHLFAEHSDTTEVSFVDFSDGGCRLRTSWQAVQTGDIIAIFWGRVEWRLGSIVWMSKDGDRQECGVQWLLRHPEPIALRFDDGEAVRGISGSCLLDGRSGVLYNARPGRGNRRCELNDGGAWRVVDLSVTKHTGLVELARALPTARPLAPPPPATSEAGAPPATPANEMWPSLGGYGSASFS